jgi:hypothetical protein
MLGRKALDIDHSLISVTTNKAMGGSSGTFSFTLKPSRAGDEKILDQIVDDDWVDIVFQRHDKRWHTMRGLVDDIRQSEAVVDGVTTNVFSITGRDFVKCWEQTPLWFSPFQGENVVGATSLKVFSTFQDVTALNPSEMAQAFLRGFVEELGNVGRANWEFPDTVPNVEAGGFINSIIFDTRQFSNDPERSALSFNYLMPNGNAWELAKQWSDPMFIELYADLLPATDRQTSRALVDDQTPFDLEDTEMTVVIRDRPFPLVSQELEFTGTNSLWFQLPMLTIPRQMVETTNKGRGGFERFNAFFVSPQIVQEVLGAGGIELATPLWDPEDIRRHGLRRFDIQSQFTSPKADLLTLSEKQRFIIRDWYMMNPYLLNGSLEIAIGLPMAKIGTKVRILGEDEDSDQTFYIEEVSHDWTAGGKLSTSLGVTRGWVGTDDSLLDVMESVAARYETPEVRTAESAT